MSGVVKKAKKMARRLVSRLLSSADLQMLSPAPSNPNPTLQAPFADQHPYASPQPSPTISVTARSVIRDLLEAVRDGSDLFLPLKATLVGVVKIWDICEVRRFSLSFLL